MLGLWPPLHTNWEDTKGGILLLEYCTISTKSWTPETPEPQHQHSIISNTHRIYISVSTYNLNCIFRNIYTLRASVWLTTASTNQTIGIILKITASFPTSSESILPKASKTSLPRHCWGSSSILSINVITVSVFFCYKVINDRHISWQFLVRFLGINMVD